MAVGILRIDAGPFTADDVQQLREFGAAPRGAVFRRSGVGRRCRDVYRDNAAAFRSAFGCDRS
jgi:hypothetical protein